MYEEPGIPSVCFLTQVFSSQYSLLPVCCTFSFLTHNLSLLCYFLYRYMKARWLPASGGRISNFNRKNCGSRLGSPFVMLLRKVFSFDLSLNGYHSTGT